MQRLQIQLLRGLVATNFIVGRCTASAIASASLKSFFCPCYRGGHIWPHQPGIVTKRCEFAAQVMCADAGFHADRQGGILASRASTWPRDHFCRSTMAPRASWPTTWNEFLPISMADHGDRVLGV